MTSGARQIESASGPSQSRTDTGLRSPSPHPHSRFLGSCRTVGRVAKRSRQFHRQSLQLPPKLGAVVSVSTNSRANHANSRFKRRHHPDFWVWRPTLVDSLQERLAESASRSAVLAVHLGRTRRRGFAGPAPRGKHQWHEGNDEGTRPVASRLQSSTDPRSLRPLSI